MRKLLFGLIVLTSVCVAQSVPCGANLDTSYHNAKPGDVLQLGACAYPAVTFTFDSTKTSTNRVVFQMQAGTTIADFNIKGAKHVSFTGPGTIFADIFATPQNGPSGGQLADDWLFDGVTIKGGGIFLRNATNFTFKNGQSGETHDARSQTIGAYAGLPPSKNILISNWRFHDMDRSANPTGHMECLFIQESDNVTVENSLFERCSIMDIFISPVSGGAAATNLTLKGNTFRTPSPERGGGAVLVNPAPTNATSNFTAQANIWDDRFLLENETSMTVTNYVWCTDNTGDAPDLLNPTSGFQIKACAPRPEPPTNLTATPR